MSGLVKQKEYDWKHSNIANIGSNLDILVSSYFLKSDIIKGTGQLFCILVNVLQAC